MPNYVIAGPDGIKDATIEVHAPNCAHLSRGQYRRVELTQVEASTPEEAALDFFGDLGYTVEDAHIFPCCKQPALAQEGRGGKLHSKAEILAEIDVLEGVMGRSDVATANLAEGMRDDLQEIARSMREEQLADCGHLFWNAD